MNHLSFYDYKHFTYKGSIKNQITCVEAGGSIFIITKNEETNSLHLHKIREQEEDQKIDLSNFNKTITSDLIFLESQQKLFLALQNEFILIDVQLKKIERIALSEPIAAAKFNPAFDLLCVVFVNGKIVCYSIDFESNELIVLNTGDVNNEVVEDALTKYFEEISKVENNADAMPVAMEIANVVIEEDSLNNKVAEAKEVISKTEIEQCNDIVDKMISADIDWVNTSNAFVVNYPIATFGRGLFVFNQTCQLMSKLSFDSELLPLIAIKVEHKALRMACVMVNETGDQILTFINKSNIEQFHKIPLAGDVVVNKLKWSPCGDYLAVSQQSKQGCFIDLFYFFNYEIKQRLRTKMNNPLVTFNFIDISYCNTMIYLTLSTINGSYTYSYMKNVWRNEPMKDHGIVCNINGATVTTQFHTQEPIRTGTFKSIENESVEQDVINVIVFSEVSNLLAMVNASNFVNIYDYSDINNWKKVKSFDLISVSSDAPISHYRFYFKVNFFRSIAIQSDKDVKFTYEDAEVVKINCDKNVIYAKHLPKTNRDVIMSSKKYPVPLKNVAILDIFSLYTVYLNINGGLFINEVQMNGHFKSMLVHYQYLVLSYKNKNETEHLLSCKMNHSGFKTIINSKDIIAASTFKAALKFRQNLLWYSIGQSDIAILVSHDGKTERVHLKNFNFITRDKDLELWLKFNGPEGLNTIKMNSINKPSVPGNTSSKIMKKLNFAQQRNTQQTPASNSASSVTHNVNSASKPNPEMSKKKLKLLNYFNEKKLKNGPPQQLDANGKKQKNAPLQKFNPQNQQQMKQKNKLQQKFNSNGPQQKFNFQKPQQKNKQKQKFNAGLQQSNLYSFQNNMPQTSTFNHQQQNVFSNLSPFLQQEYIAPQPHFQNPLKRLPTNNPFIQPQRRLRPNVPPEDLHVIIMDNNMPDGCMSENYAASFRQRILSAIDETIYANRQPPKFDEANLIWNHFEVKCADPESLQWLKNTVGELCYSNKQLFNLRIVPKQFSPTFKKVTVFIPGELEASGYFLERLSGQNPMLDTSNWTIYNDKKYNDGILYFIKVDQYSYNELQRLDRKIYVGLDRLEFKDVCDQPPQYHREFEKKQTPWIPPPNPGFMSR